MATSFSGGRSRSTRREPPCPSSIQRFWLLIWYLQNVLFSSSFFLWSDGMCKFRRSGTYTVELLVHVYSLEKYFKKSLPFFFVFTVLMFSLIQTIIYKTLCTTLKIEHNEPNKMWGELRYFIGVSTSISGTLRISLVTKSLVSQFLVVKLK
jgi:hypothetical protein